MNETIFSNDPAGQTVGNWQVEKIVGKEKLPAETRKVTFQ